MSTRFIRVASAAFLAGLLGQQHALADISTWVDASGVVNVSNLAPPDGVRVVKVIREMVSTTTTRNDAAREAARQAEVQALAMRVAELQDQVIETRRQTSLAMQYQAAPSPAFPYPVADVAPQPVQYAENVATPTSFGCDPTWFNCGFWWGSGAYPASVVVFSSPKFRRSFPSRGGHPFVGHQPMRPPGAPHRR